MGKTSAAVKNRYAAKTYDRVVVMVKKDISAAFKQKCDDLGITRSEVLHKAINEFLQEEK